MKGTITNPENFGLVTVNSDRNKWKILDFRVTDDSDFYVNPNIRNGVEAGNGIFNYDYPSFMNYIFKNKDYQKIRRELTIQVMAKLNQGKLSQTGRKMSFSKAMDAAYSEINNYITQNYNALHIHKESALQDLANMSRL